MTQATKQLSNSLQHTIGLTAMKCVANMRGYDITDNDKLIASTVAHFQEVARLEELMTTETLKLSKEPANAEEMLVALASAANEFFHPH